MANITDSKYLTSEVWDFNQSAFQSKLYLEFPLFLNRLLE